MRVDQIHYSLDFARLWAPETKIHGPPEMRFIPLAAAKATQASFSDPGWSHIFLIPRLFASWRTFSVTEGGVITETEVCVGYGNSRRLFKQATPSISVSFGFTGNIKIWSWWFLPLFPFWMYLDMRLGSKMSPRERPCLTLSYQFRTLFPILFRSLLAPTMAKNFVFLKKATCDICWQNQRIHDNNNPSANRSRSRAFIIFIF